MWLDYVRDVVLALAQSCRRYVREVVVFASCWNSLVIKNLFLTTWCMNADSAFGKSLIAPPGSDLGHLKEFSLDLRTVTSIADWPIGISCAHERNQRSRQGCRHKLHDTLQTIVTKIIFKMVCQFHFFEYFCMSCSLQEAFGEGHGQIQRNLINGRRLKKIGRMKKQNETASPPPPPPHLPHCHPKRQKQKILHTPFSKIPKTD